MFAGVGERLQAVQDAVGRVAEVATPRERHVRRGSGSTSTIRRPPRVRTILRTPSNRSRGVEEPLDSQFSGPSTCGVEAQARHRTAGGAPGARPARTGGRCKGAWPRRRRRRAGDPSSVTGIRASSAGPMAPSTLASMTSEVRARRGADESRAPVADLHGGPRGDSMNQSPQCGKTTTSRAPLRGGTAGSRARPFRRLRGRDRARRAAATSSCISNPEAPSPAAAPMSESFTRATGPPTQKSRCPEVT